MITEDPSLPLPPQRGIEDERAHRKSRLAAAFRLFGRFGFSEGLAGHITARDPERTDHFWVNPLGLNFSQIRVSDLLLINSEGAVVAGDRPVNLAAFAIHSQVHDARPDVIGAAHAHSLYGKALSALGDPLLPITQDACAFHGLQASYDEYAGVVFDSDEGRRIAGTLGFNRLVVLANHGFLSVGTSVESAAWWFITAERSAQTQLVACAAGEPRLIDEETAKVTAAQVGSENVGRLSFESLYEWIVTLHPDLLD